MSHLCERPCGYYGLFAGSTFLALFGLALFAMTTVADTYSIPWLDLKFNPLQVCKAKDSYMAGTPQPNLVKTQLPGHTWLLAFETTALLFVL
jgi:hypothetical protein